MVEAHRDSHTAPPELVSGSMDFITTALMREVVFGIYLI